MTGSPLDRLKRGCVQLLSETDLLAKLGKNKPLRVKLGVDPTAPDIHLGHTVALTKLRLFQDLGHTVVFIIGDFTALIGDPSGRSETRPPMKPEDVDRNAQTYLDQVFRILDPAKTEVRRNSEWLRPLFAREGHDASRPESIGGLLARYTVQQLTEREDFKQRLKSGNPISLLELLYPLLQGYDSVAVKADVELGGTDQLFNLLMGRQLQKDAGQEAQVVMTLPLLEGTDGVRKMSKSYGNYIGLDDAPGDMFGKVMSIPDELMWKYYEILTEEDIPAAKALHPMEAKKRLAGHLVARYHGSEAGAAARAEFERVFSQRDTPLEMAEHRASRTPIPVIDLLVESGLAPSRNEARRLVKQGAVEWSGRRLSAEETLAVDDGAVLKVGKRQYRKIRTA